MAWNSVSVSVNCMHLTILYWHFSRSFWIYRSDHHAIFNGLKDKYLFIFTHHTTCGQSIVNHFIHLKQTFAVFERCPFNRIEINSVWKRAFKRKNYEKFIIYLRALPQKSMVILTLHFTVFIMIEFWVHKSINLLGNYSPFNSWFNSLDNW